MTRSRFLCELSRQSEPPPRWRSVKERKAPMGLFERFRRWRCERRLLRICGCICYCSTCREPLNDQRCENLGEGRYRYTCRCGSSCTFDFAIAPVPVKTEDHV